jgi:hypothetical protein
VDANAAWGMLPDNPMVLSVRIYARVVAAGIYQETKLAGRSEEVMRGAATDVQALEPLIGTIGLSWALWLYYETTGAQEKATDVALRWLKRTRTPLAAFHCVVSLYRQDRFAEALQCLAQRRNTDLDGDVTRAAVLAELPDGPRLALQAYEQMEKTYPRMRTQVYVLLLLGKQEEALPTLREIVGDPALRELVGDPGSRDLFEEKLLSRAGTSRNRQAQAHHLMGLLRLSKADRLGAREHFQKAVSTRAYWRSAYYWSQMYFSRLEKDRTWPKWISDKP